MKLVDNILLFRLRNMEIKVNIRMLFLSIVILVVGILYILLGIRFDLEKNFLLYEIGNNDYRLVISHDDFDLLNMLFFQRDHLLAHHYTYTFLLPPYNYTGLLNGQILNYHF